MMTRRLKRRLLWGLAAAVVAWLSQALPPGVSEPAPAQASPPTSVETEARQTSPGRAPGWPPQLGNTGTLRTGLRLVRAADGDSLIARTPGGEELRIRLSGIDAPEKAQPGGREAQQALQALLGRPFEARLLKKDGYGRWLAVLQSSDGQDVNHAQLLAGHAWYFQKYERDIPRVLREPYEQAAQQARLAGIGLWSAPSPQPPWEYRQESRR